MERSFVYDHILKNNKIVAYLAEKGYRPDSEGEGQWKYCCPLHSEDTPSFYVYAAGVKDAKFDNFYCYGCKAGGSIIALKMKLEGVNGGEAVRSLAQGLEYDNEEEVRFLLAKLKEEGDAFAYTPDDLSVAVSRMIHRYFTVTKFAEPYFSRGEKALKYLDDLLNRCDLVSAMKMYECMEGVLRRAIDRYVEEQEREQDDLVRAYASIR
jgi:hypothetical protein